MGIRAAFWLAAHRRYQIRKPSIGAECAALTWFAFFAFVYGAALLKGWRTDFTGAVIGFALVGVPLIYVLAHRSIRIVRNKGADALYRKWLEVKRK